MATTLSPDRFNTFQMGYRTNRYPNPFFDLAHTYLPTSIKSMFEWCQYYFFANPLVNAVVYKCAEYPITEIVVDEVDPTTKEYWEDVINKKLKLQTFLLEVGLDYYTYGNAYVSIFYPFKKYLKCKHCKHLTPIETSKYKFKNLKFFHNCQKCNHGQDEAEVVDLNVPDLKGIRLVRWNPKHITPDYNEITGDITYYLDLPPGIRSDLMVGRKNVLESLPNIYLDAVKEFKALRIEKDNFFHLKRPTIAQKDMGFGFPILFPVFKDTYYAQILRKAQESIAQGHIVPLKFIFPQAGSSTSDPYTTYNLSTWRGKVEEEILKWRMDQNYIPITPVPVGHQLIGGEGKALMLSQELKQVAEQIVAGMHAPLEFIFGGMTYSGSNISMRMLENQFLKYRQMLLELSEMVLTRIAAYLGKKAPKIGFKKFKMADDLQRVQLLFNMNQAQKISDRTLLSEVDLDLDTEEKHKKVELAKQLGNQRTTQLAMAQIGNEVAALQAKGQFFAQQTQQNLSAPPQPQPDPQPDQSMAGMSPETTVYAENGQSEPPGIPNEMQSPLMAGQSGNGVDLRYLAKREAATLERLPPEEKQARLQNLQMTNPQLYRLILMILMSGEGSQENPLDAGQMPMPEIRPPRRQAR